MNKVILMGRLCNDVEARYTQNGMCVARYRLAVDRRFKREGEPEADFLSIVAFNKAGEFAEKWFRKGMKVVVEGRIQTGSYTNKEGQKVYTTDIIAEDQEFAESKKASEENNNSAPQTQNNASDEFMSIPDEISEDLPWS